ncbi:hypothetical protein J6590_029460 [Homalodisca vitripennis]|nr:hypothetical protein J6590_029460 [Homalodisca vitripennis]
MSLSQHSVPYLDHVDSLILICLQPETNCSPGETETYIVINNLLLKRKTDRYVTYLDNILQDSFQTTGTRSLCSDRERARSHIARVALHRNGLSIQRDAIPLLFHKITLLSLKECVKSSIERLREGLRRQTRVTSIDNLGS